MTSNSELNTFGSVLTFAISLEDTARAFYEGLSKKGEHPFSNEIFKELREGNRKRRELLERTRRESVVEMILERISDLDRAEYLVEIARPPNKVEANDLEVAIELERRIGRFYSDSANKTKFLPEVSRTLERLARNSGEREARLRSL